MGVVDWVWILLWIGSNPLKNKMLPERVQTTNRWTAYPTHFAIQKVVDNYRPKVLLFTFVSSRGFQIWIFTVLQLEWCNINSSV